MIKKIKIEPTVLSGKALFAKQNKNRKIRVCAYIRVSTDQDEQLNSLESQRQRYERIINIDHNDSWIFAGIYSDKGKSGTQIKHRDQYQKMLMDARTGKIDLVLVKSIARFGRNTQETLSVIKEFRLLNVEIYFEQEDFYSSDNKIDMFLTILASLAQEEFRQTSERVTMGLQEKMESGSLKTFASKSFGFRKSADGTLYIVRSEEIIIRMVFNLFMSGLSRGAIQKFIDDEIHTSMHYSRFTKTTVCNLLINPKVNGDTVLQKTYVKSYLDHRPYMNKGERAKYIFENSLEKIIPDKIFNLVGEMDKNKSNQNYCLKPLKMIISIALNVLERLARFSHTQRAESSNACIFHAILIERNIRIAIYAMETPSVARMLWIS